MVNLKIIISLIWLLMILIGAWPVLKESTLISEGLKFIPSTGMAYQGIIVAAGLLALLYGMRKENVKVK